MIQLCSSTHAKLIDEMTQLKHISGFADSLLPLFIRIQFVAAV